MPLPIGYMYQEKALGAGTVGTVQHYNIEHVPAGTDLNYGVAIKIQDQAGVVADKAPIFGIATKRGYAMGDDYSAIEDDHWYKGEDMGVLTEGAISVPITADVNRLDLAAINADGTFKPAGAGDTAVGHFLTAGDKDSTAIVYVNLTSVNTTATVTPDVSGAGK